MQIDGENDDQPASAFVDPDDSFAGVQQADPDTDEAYAEVQAALAEPQATQPVPVEAAPVVTQDEPGKTCCICGLDVSQKARSRDRSGRLWCAHCNDFDTSANKTPGLIPCPDCGRHTRPMLMVDQKGERVCQLCHEGFIAEAKHRRVNRATVTAHPELELRRSIQGMVNFLLALTGLAAVVTMYHYRVFYVHPKNWVPFESALVFCGAMGVALGIIIAIQFIRMEIRKRVRLAEYDEMVHAAANHVLALDEDSHTMGISESPEPLRRRVERAIARVEACGGLGMPEAGKIIDSLAKHSNVVPLTEFLLAQRPNTTDTVARNREIAIISYLQVNLAIASSAVTAILLRVHHDQDAMTRHALICFRNGELLEAKKIFKRVINVAKEKNSDVDLAAAFSNLGMLHVMLSEFDDASVRYSQAMVIYTRLKREDGQADCLLNLGLIAFKQKKWVEVEDQLRKAMTINRRRNRREGLSICCSLLGMILIEKEVPQLTEAKKLLNQAVRLNTDLGRPGNVAAAYGNLGLICVKRQDFPGATDLFLKAQGIYQRINRPKMTAKIQGMLKTVSTLSAAKAARSK